MTIVEEVIKIENEEIIITNHRALFWKREGALILSDLHIGKTAHFRKHGIPIPDNILIDDLSRLESLIRYYKAKKVLIVGDLFHAGSNIDISTFKDWIMSFKDLEIILIKGNHDRVSKQLMSDLNIKTVTELSVAPFTFVHDCIKLTKNEFFISGHTHPGVVIKGKGKQLIKLPCYQVSKMQLILPAFSLFTGLNTNDKPKDSICFAFTDTSIFKF